MGDTEILATALNGLTARLDSDAEERRAFAENVEQRLRTVHEDSRRDRRELIGRIDQWGRGLSTAMKTGFHNVDARLDEVCDVGKVDHARYDRGILELNQRLDERANQAEGRAQILRPLFGLVQKHGPLVICLILAAYTGARDFLPLAIATNSDVAAINAVAPFDQRSEPPPKPPANVAAIEPAQPLRGFQ
jgi:hypothetical protein